MSVPTNRRGRLARACAVFSALVCAALVAGSVSPVSAAEGDGDTGSVVVGAFAVGDGLEATLDERDGALQLAIPVGPLQVTWDSRAVGADEFGLGSGWSFGFGRVSTAGGISVHPASAPSSYPTDPTHPSGLAGYGGHDVVFEQRGGDLPPHPGDRPAGPPDEGPAAVDYAFVLHELGGDRTHFNALGDPVARFDAFDARMDWTWDDAVPHRLLAVVNHDGVRVTLDWLSEPGRVVIRAGANLGHAEGSEAVWRVDLDGGRVSAVTDASGGRIGVDYGDSWLVSTITGAAGAATHVAWRTREDGIARASRVITTDPAGAIVSMREWEPVGDALPSGWPVYDTDGDLFWSGDAAYRYRTVLSDGATRVESEYNSLHTLVRRRMLVSTSSGERELQGLDFSYPGTEGHGVPDPAALPPNWAHPIHTEVTYRDVAGASRTASESAEFDAEGRPISRTAADGTVTTTEYDRDPPSGRALPVGLPILRTVAAPDGQTETTRHELNAERTAVVAIEVTSASPRTEPIVSRTEFDVSAHGLVTERRAYPDGGHGGEPVVTRWTDAVDLAAGVRTATETVAAGTPAEATVTEETSLVHGGVLTRVGPAGTIERATYDPLGRWTRATDAAGRETVARYETATVDGRNAVIVTGPDRVAITEEQDVLGRTVRVTDNIRDGRVDDAHTRVVETREYPAPGLARRTDAWGATTTVRQDVFGRVVETVTPTGLVELKVHDDVAMTVTSALTPTGRLADAELVDVERLDVAGRPVEQSGTRTDGSAVPTMRTVYDGFGRAIATDDGSLETRVEYDAVGNAVTTTMRAIGDAEAAGADPLVTASRRFDGFGESLEKTLSDGATSRSGGARTIDGQGRTTGRTDQLGRPTETRYTADGLPSGVATEGGQVAEYEYHPATRLLELATVTSPVGAAVNIAYEHDPVTDAVTGVYDPADRAGTEIRTTYDAHGNPLTVTYPDGNAIGYRYDAHGRRTGITDIAGNSTTLTHTSAGVLTRAEQRDGRGELVSEVAYGHDAFGRVDTLTRGNGVTTAYTFTSASQIATERTTGPGGAELSAREYTYDPHGNLTQRTDRLTDTTDAGAAESSTRTTVYTYDALDRLVGSTVHDGDSPEASVVEETRYELSVGGDIIAETVTVSPGGAGQTGTTRRFEYSPTGELSGISNEAVPAIGVEPELVAQTYDVAGNLTRSAAGTEYAYDALNRPVTETTAEGTSVTVDYWADGSRRSRTTTEPDGTVYVSGFYWDGAALVNDTHATDSGSMGTASYLFGAARHARTTVPDQGASTTRYYGTDRHNNITDLTDHTGQVTARYGYTDYGTPTHAADDRPGLERNPFGYAGEYTDPEGTQHLGARDYDPESARFTTMDTEELHNLYAFADLNPITNIDPTGRFSQDDLIRQVVVGGLGVAFFVLGALATWLNPGLGIAFLGTGGMLLDFAATGLTAVSMANELAEEQFITDTLITEIMQWGEVALVIAGAAVAVGMLIKAFFGMRHAARAALKTHDTAMVKIMNGQGGDGNGRPGVWYAIVGTEVVDEQGVILPGGSVLFARGKHADDALMDGLLGHSVSTHKVVEARLEVRSVRSFASSPHAPAFDGTTADAAVREVVGIGTDTKTGKLGIGGKTFGRTGELNDNARIEPTGLKNHLFGLDDGGQGVDVGLIIDGNRTRAVVGRRAGIRVTVRDFS